MISCVHPAIPAATEATQVGDSPAELDYDIGLRAEMTNKRSVYVLHDANVQSVVPEDYTLTDFEGTSVPITAILPQTATRTLIVPSEDLDISRVYYLTRKRGGLRTRVRFDGWFRTLYSDLPLGATYDAERDVTYFNIFSPRARNVKLYLYEHPDDTAAYRQIDLRKDDAGVWTMAVQGNLHGTYYDYTVHGSAGPGNAFYETHPVHISDPYARVMTGSLGRARVWTHPETSTQLRASIRMEDVVAYEVHVQDFTDRLPETARAKGPFRAMMEPGLTNARGEPIGFDYLVSLGVNVVHLMPVQEYLHHPDTAWNAAFSNDLKAQALGVSEENYQWGYRTTHAFAIENRYGDPRRAPGNERAAFRDLVEAFHAKGIAVIIDIVPNHTGENMDGHERLMNFNVLDKAYYYRTNDNVEHIGPFGNEIKTEDRPMVQRWLIDQCIELVEAFGIDGFRIDLAGQIDEQTLKALRAALGPDVLIYGEPWIDVTDEYVRANPDWDWYKEDSPITFFQDDARNAFKGSPFILEEKKRDRGYAGGNGDQREDVMRALANQYAEESTSPNQGLNYLDIHDNWALADRFARSSWNGLEGVDEAHYRIAAGLLLTSLGPMVIHGGAEIMRSKGLAPLEEWQRETSFGEIHFKGRDDTYNLRTPNQFVWETVGASGNEVAADYAAMQAWWEGLIKFRLSETGQAFRRAESLPDTYYNWILPEDTSLLGYVVDEQILVLVNIGEEAGTFNVSDLPNGNWRQISDGEAIDFANGLGEATPSSELQTLSLMGPSFAMWVREAP